MEAVWDFPASTLSAHSCMPSPPTRTSSPSPLHTSTPHLLPQPAPKLLGNALGHTHSGDSARLRASDLALACVAHFGQVLRGGKCGRFGQCGAE